MYYKRNFNRAYNRQSDYRRNDYRRNNYRVDAKPVHKFRDFPKYITNIYDIIMSNADLKRFAALNIQKLLSAKGEIPDNAKGVRVEFEHAGKYSVSYYIPSDNDVHNPRLGKDYGYDTEEFYLGLMAASTAIAKVFDNNFSILYQYIKPSYNTDTKALEKKYQSLVDFVSDREIRQIANRMNDEREENDGDSATGE